MSEMETFPATTSQTLKRKPKQKSKKPNKKLKLSKNAAMTGAAKRKKPTKRLLQLFQKRAKKYNSDSSESEDDEDEEEREDGLSGSEGEEEEGGERGGSGITRFSEGCNAFKVAFLKIMKKSQEFTDPLGPILSGHQKLVATKLAEDEEENKPKGDKKDKQLAKEKGHVKPESYLDAKEKLLISIATKGVVRLFNAVSKAQNPQKGLNPSLSKDAKALAKHRKQTFLSELKKPSVSSVNEESNNVGWAPLRDSYMLGSKLKDWDKMPDTNEGGEKNDYMQSSDEE